MLIEVTYCSWKNLTFLLDVAYCIQFLAPLSLRQQAQLSIRELVTCT